MSSGQKAVSEDEDAWYDLKLKIGLQDVAWDVYSREARAAKELNKTLGSTGSLLKLDVMHFMIEQRVKEDNRRERAQFIEAKKIMEKYS